MKPTRIDGIEVSVEEHRRLTLVAVAQVKAGEVVDHAAVKAWAASLGTDKPLQPPLWHTREER